MWKAAATTIQVLSGRQGRDSFVILGQIDPGKVRARSKWAERFLCLLKEKIDSESDLASR
jgi:hypothetical protein